MEQRFERAIEDDLLPALKACPGLKDVQALWPREREDNAPEIACQLLLMFEDAAGIEVMLGSSERAAARELVPSITSVFEGTVSHVNYEVR